MHSNRTRNLVITCWRVRFALVFSQPKSAMCVCGYCNWRSCIPKQRFQFSCNIFSRAVQEMLGKVFNFIFRPRGVGFHGSLSVVNFCPALWRIQTCLTIASSGSFAMHHANFDFVPKFVEHLFNSFASGHSILMYNYAFNSDSLRSPVKAALLSKQSH